MRCWPSWVVNKAEDGCGIWRLEMGHTHNIWDIKHRIMMGLGMHCWRFVMTIDLIFSPCGKSAWVCFSVLKPGPDVELFMCFINFSVGEYESFR